MNGRRRQIVVTGAGLMLASSWRVSAIAGTAAPLLVVIDIDTPGARNAFKNFVETLERRFAASSVKPEVRFVPAGAELEEQKTRSLENALKAIRPDIIMAANSGFAQMANTMNLRRPIIFFSLNDPVAAGLTDSLTRPNKGMTGFTLGTGVVSKRREMLLRLVPLCRIMGLLSSTLHPGEGQIRSSVNSMKELPGIEQRRFNCDDLKQLVTLLKTKSARAVDAWDVDYVFVPFRYPEETVREFNTLHRPVIYPRMKHVHHGGMAAYEPRIDEADEAWVSQVASLLAGVPIENIPIVQATRYSFGLNLKACRRVGIEPPKSLIKIADVVIE